MWDTIKHTNTCNGSAKQREEREKEKVFEEIMAVNFPNLMKNIHLHIQEAQLREQ